MCNIRLKQGTEQQKGGLQRKNPKTGMVHVIKTAEDVVAFNEASLTSLSETAEKNPEDPKAKASRLKENAKTVQKCKEKTQRRNYQQLTGNIAGFANQGDLEKRHTVQDSQFAFTFGFGFITLMFLGFVSGYFLARRVLGWDQIDSMFMSLFIGISTLILEAVLMIFRLDKYSKIQDRERKRLQID